MIINYPYFDISEEFSFELVVNANDSITIPMLSGYTHNYIINYGDNTGYKTITSYNDTDATHIYTSGGTYKVIIRGICETFYINNTGNIRTKITKIFSFGNTKFKKFRLYNCTNFSKLPSVLSQSPLEECQDLDFTFYGTKITSVPENLFGNNTTVISFNSTFANCSFLTSVPEKLFRYCTNTRDFSATFFQSGLEVIPENLFKYNLYVETFYSCFGETNITEVPENLFKYNLAVVSFRETFIDCHSLLTIYSDLFRYNIYVTTFEYTFLRCDHLTEIPNGLLLYNINAINYNGTFRNATIRAKINPYIFYNYGGGSTRFSDDVNFHSFDYCFYSDWGEFLGNKLDAGTVPDLWNYISGGFCPGNLNDCYGASGSYCSPPSTEDYPHHYRTNYTDIPGRWL